MRRAADAIAGRVEILALESGADGAGSAVREGFRAAHGEFIITLDPDVSNPAAGDWYIGIEGYAAYSGVSLQATYSGGGGGGGQQLLANPGFESGTVSWTAASGG